jgi:hypothetical protein
MRDVILPVGRVSIPDTFMLCGSGLHPRYPYLQLRLRIAFTKRSHAAVLDLGCVGGTSTSRSRRWVVDPWDDVTRPW